MVLKQMKFDIVTIFRISSRPARLRHRPPGARGHLVEIAIHDLRKFTNDKHQTVDDRPFGGGEGMVLKPEPSSPARYAQLRPPRRPPRQKNKQSIILLSRQGQRFDQKPPPNIATLDQIALICGRYEGVDERVNTGLADREVSIGDYVLSGGELVQQSSWTPSPASPRGPRQCRFSRVRSVILPLQSRMLPQTAPITALRACLDYPISTRPAEFRGLSGTRSPHFRRPNDKIRPGGRRTALKRRSQNRLDCWRAWSLPREDPRKLRTRS